MNIFYKVTLQSLKKNKTRTIVTIIGIMLSTAMICAVTTFVSSIQNYLLEYTIYNDGDWHGAVYDAAWSDYQSISADERVSGAAYGQLLGYAKVDSQNEFKPYLYVIGGQPENYFETMPIHLVSGRLPENGTELLIPRHLSSNGGLNYREGDTITLELGERMLDGYSMGQNNPCYIYDSSTGGDVLNGEVIEVRDARTYTVVGIYERPSFEERTAPGYTALTVADGEFGDSARFNVYFRMKRPAEVYDFLEKTLQETGLGGTQNTDVLLFMGVSKYDSFSVMIVSLAAIVICLIVFGSVSLIYNAFSISVSERTKQFGLLSSVGATRKQLKKMVIFEALAVSAAGIPLGILGGIAGIGVTLLLIGGKFASLLGGFVVGTFVVPMRVCVSWQAVVIAAIVALVTVLISAWLPSKRATKVSAVEAIRQNTDIKMKEKPVRTAKLTYLLFGLPGVLASKYYKRSRKKYRATVISLFMSIVLFVSASAFTDYLMESVSGGYAPEEYDLCYEAGGDDLEKRTPEEILELLLSDQHVAAGAYTYTGYFYGNIDNRYLTDEFAAANRVKDEAAAEGAEETAGAESTEEAAAGTEGIEAKAAGTENAEVKAEEEEAAAAKAAETEIYGYAYFILDDEFEKLLEAYHLKREDYFDTENPLGIAVDGSVWFDPAKQKYVTLNTLNTDACEIACQSIRRFEGYSQVEGKYDEEGNEIYCFRNDKDRNDIIELPEAEAFVTYTLKAGKRITDAPYYVTRAYRGNLQMIYPLSMLDSVLPRDTRDVFYAGRFYLVTDDHRASYDNLRKVLSANEVNGGYITDYAESTEEERNIVTIIQVFSYGFIVLISLIAAANVFNTISTNVNLRRREFAMLKSVGMTRRGFNRMMNFECLLYGSRALLFGLPVSAGVTWLIYRAVNGGYETEYHLPWSAIGIAVLSVFLVVFVTMMYSMGKVKKDNPIDALKNENL
ncbi:MAG: ABC transporter permease [Butyrivibrio sp.]|nr:ABC transporter permease [Acetatifactor muris]MCM1558679.1 ABC transporter permease [Butyrivibrio sp.]